MTDGPKQGCDHARTNNRRGRGRLTPSLPREQPWLPSRKKSRQRTTAGGPNRHRDTTTPLRNVLVLLPCLLLPQAVVRELLLVVSPPQAPPRRRLRSVAPQQLALLRPKVATTRVAVAPVGLLTLAATPATCLCRAANLTACNVALRTSGGATRPRW
jgi:hypothetical protein